LANTFLQRHFASIDGYIRIGWRLIGGTDAGKFLDFPLARLGVHPFRVAFLTNRERRFAVNFQKVTMRNQGAYLFTLGTQGGDECGKDDGAGFKKEFGDFADAAQIFGAVIETEAEVATEAVANIVAIEDEGSTTVGMQHLFNGVCQGGFA
jgi:hypothetical protein